MIHLPNLITDLALILASAAVVTLIFKKLKQPLVLGYIIAGIIVGPNFTLFPSISDIESIKIWAEIGVIFLLFSLGLEFSFKKLMKIITKIWSFFLKTISIPGKILFFADKLVLTKNNNVV